ncbi:ribosome modulation factor [Hansschlegelia beijingensis]
MQAIEQEGREAFATGVDLRRCPYKDVARRDAWLKGWVDARRVSRMPG